MPVKASVVALAAPLLLAAGALAQPAEQFVIAGDSIVAPNGGIVEGRALLVDRDGMIRRVAQSEDLLELETRQDLYEGAVVTPGLFDLASLAGLGAEGIENTVAVDDQLRAIDGFDPLSSDLHGLLVSGVTAAMVIPQPTNPVSGRSATISTATGEAWVEDGSMLFTVAPSALDSRFGPTSRTGALELLRRTLGDASSGAGALAEVVRGERRAVLYGSAADEAIAGYTAMATYGVEPTIALAEELVTLALDMGEDTEGATVIAGPFGFDASPLALGGPGLLDRSGASVAFAGGEGGVRQTAALSVRYGMSPDAARRGMTSVAAEIAGVGDLTGSLQPGMRADLVVWSGDPLRLDARVLAVYIGGELVYSNTTEMEEME